MKNVLLGLVWILATLPMVGQVGSVRGHVIDSLDGMPIAYCSVRLSDSDQGVFSDNQGFFQFAGLAPGGYTLTFSYLGYADKSVSVEVASGAGGYYRVLLEQSAIELQQVDVSAERQLRNSIPLVSRLQIRAEEVRAIPAIGGEADLAQYLSVLPGVVQNGDQGGQLFIRGGEPVQNKIILDGIPLFNPFHSIGLFSVFEAEALRSADVYTAAFPADYGGRVSSVLDIKTREGNVRRMAGLVSASPFQVKALVEGPLKKLDAQGKSLTFLLTGKQGLIAQTSPHIYPNAVDSDFFSFASRDSAQQQVIPSGLPYRWTDLFGKISWIGSQGSKIDGIGFRFEDIFEVAGVARIGWSATGGGTHFFLVPAYSDIQIDGNISYSTYSLEAREQTDAPRRTAVSSYVASLNFSSLQERYQLRYGFELSGFNTDFRFVNPLGIAFSQEDFTTELSGYVRYLYQGRKLLVEPGLRLHYYASQSNIQLEPRASIKYNLSSSIRLKGALGWYSQNILGTVNDLDIVNFFVGYLAGPERSIFEPGTAVPVRSRLQLARHLVVGMEMDLGQPISVNMEAYYKDFNQIIQLNKNKVLGSDPDFVLEKGYARGADLFIKYRGTRFSGQLGYGLAQVKREDATQEYPTSFDRRHNLNLLAFYLFGKGNRWEASFHWNLGSGFPFTQTLGFYQQVPIDQNTLGIDPVQGNYPVGVILSPVRNGGRLPYYHRLDLSLRRHFSLGRTNELELNASVSNAYNRPNVFYVDRVRSKVVNQLPIIPSLGITGRF